MVVPYLRFVRIWRKIMSSKRLILLRFMISSMLNCVPILMWAVVVVMFVLSFFSVLFMQVASDWLISYKGPPTAEDQSAIDALRTYFNGFWVTMVSLLMAVTGGTDWQDIYNPLAHIDPFLGICFLCYMCLMVLGVFNVLVGICADRAFAASRNHRDFTEHEEMMRMLSLMQDVTEIFATMNMENPDTITLEQFLSCQNDVHVVSFFKKHQMHMIEPICLFNMLDKDGSGSLTLSELTVGLLRLSGHARSSDVLLLVMLTMEVRDALWEIQRHTERKSVSFNGAHPTPKITQPTDDVEELK